MSEEVKTVADTPDMPVTAPEGEMTQEPDFKALFIKERYERLQIEAASLQKRFGEVQRELAEIEKMIKPEGEEGDTPEEPTAE